MTNGDDGDDIRQPVPAIEPVENTFFDRNLRRIYLSDVPTALTGGIIPNATSFPASPTLYQLFYRTDLAKLYFWDGANWLQIGMLDSSTNLKIGGKYLKE